MQSFQRDLSAIAEGYGVTDWEQDDATYLAIGGGLAKAGVTGERYQLLSVELSNQNQSHLTLVNSGYKAYGTR